MDMELEINCFWHTTETKKASETGMEYDLLDCDVRKYTFYSIDAILPYDNNHDDQSVTKIVSGGDYFIAVDDYETIKKKIKEAREAYKNI